MGIQTKKKFCRKYYTVHTKKHKTQKEVSLCYCHAFFANRLNKFSYTDIFIIMI